jgi:2-oxoglutarate ferredoxin oxidoreductase subunit alpha
MLEDAEYMLVSYGTTSRICKDACRLLREKGIKAGLFRPISLWPFPEKILNDSLENIKKVFVIELAQEQLEVDVRLSAEGKRPVKGFFKPGSSSFKEEEIAEFVSSSV